MAGGEGCLGSVWADIARRDWTAYLAAHDAGLQTHENTMAVHERR
jgi:hypothetical protein